MRELPAGRDALLLDFSDEDVPWRSAIDAAHRLGGARRAGELPTVMDLVPAASTVLVACTPGAGLDHLGLHRVLRRPASVDPPDDAAPAPDDLADTPTVIGVRYDGPDLAEVAEATGLGIDRVVAAHSTGLWRVQFMGFAPGFAYLIPHHDDSNATAGDLSALIGVRRRDEARTAVPAGAVAVAAGYSAVYPRSSPGGWNLLGHSDICLWDVTDEPPAMLRPGGLVRFEVR